MARQFGGGSVNVSKRTREHFHILLDEHAEYLRALTAIDSLLDEFKDYLLSNLSNRKLPSA